MNNVTIVEQDKDKLVLQFDLREVENNSREIIVTTAHDYVKIEQSVLIQDKKTFAIASVPVFVSIPIRAVIEQLIPLLDKSYKEDHLINKTTMTPNYNWSDCNLAFYDNEKLQWQYYIYRRRWTKGVIVDKEVYDYIIENEN